MEPSMGKRRQKRGDRENIQQLVGKLRGVYGGGSGCISPRGWHLTNHYNKVVRDRTLSGDEIALNYGVAFRK